jgi:hypothetical protein
MLRNGNFRLSVAPWRGRGIRLVPNPVRRGDTSLAMGNNSYLYQNIQTNIERGCAHYLQFRIFNNRPSVVPPQLIASVAYLDRQRRLLQSTPVLVEPPYPATPQFTSFFTIVPPPPLATRTISVVFLLRRGSVLIDYVSVAPRRV